MPDSTSTVVSDTLQTERGRNKRREHLLEGENEVLKLIIDRAPLPTVLEALTKVAERQSAGGLLASVLLLDSDGLHLRHGAAPSLPPEYSAAIDGVAIGPDVGSCGTAAYTRTQVIVSDIMTDPLWADFRDLASKHGLRACWSTPIMSANRQVLGTFALYYRQPCTPDSDDEAMIEILTRTAALAIGHSRAESELADSEERFRSLTRCAPVGVFMIDSSGVFSYVNPRFIEISGYEYEKTFDYWLEEVTGDSQIRGVWRKAMNGRLEYSGEFAVHRNGVNRSVCLRMAPMRSRTGEDLGYVGTLEDVTARINGEAALHKEVTLRRAIEESIPGGIAVIGADRTQTYVNRAFTAMVGWPAEELIGIRMPFPYWPDEDISRIEHAFSATIRGHAPSEGSELRFRRKNGEIFPVLVKIAPLRDEHDVSIGWVSSVTDLSERKKVQPATVGVEERLRPAS